MKSEITSSLFGEKTLPSTFREIRTKLNLTQEQLASILGVRQNSVWRWEKGETIPVFRISQIKNLLLILEKAGISLDDIPDS